MARANWAVIRGDSILCPPFVGALGYLAADLGRPRAEVLKDNLFRGVRRIRLMSP